MLAEFENSAFCRFCRSPLRHTFADLGMSPPCESNLDLQQLNDMELFYPLRVLVCDECFLVQLEEYVSPQSIFTEYAYFSSLFQPLAGARESICRSGGRTPTSEREQPGGGVGQQ